MKRQRLSMKLLWQFALDYPRTTNYSIERDGITKFLHLVDAQMKSTRYTTKSRKPQSVKGDQS